MFLEGESRKFADFHGGFVEVEAKEAVHLTPVTVLVGARDQADDGLELFETSG